MRSHGTTKRPITNENIRHGLGVLLPMGQILPVNMVIATPPPYSASPLQSKHNRGLRFLSPHPLTLCSLTKSLNGYQNMYFHKLRIIHRGIKMIFTTKTTTKILFDTLRKQKFWLHYLACMSWSLIKSKCLSKYYSTCWPFLPLLANFSVASVSNPGPLCLVQPLIGANLANLWAWCITLHTIPPSLKRIISARNTPLKCIWKHSRKPLQHEMNWNASHYLAVSLSLSAQLQQCAQYFFLI